MYHYIYHPFLPRIFRILLGTSNTLPPPSLPGKKTKTSDVLGPTGPTNESSSACTLLAVRQHGLHGPRRSLDAGRWALIRWVVV